MYVFNLINILNRSALAINANPSILKALNNDEDPAAPILEICIDTDLGSVGTRALCAALLVRAS